MKCVIAGTKDALAAMEDIARMCSPRVEIYSDAGVIAGTDAGVIFDADGLTRIFGIPVHLAHEVQRLAAERQLNVRVAVAATSTSAWLLATHSRKPVTVVEHGHEAAALANVPVDALLTVRDLAPMADDVRKQRVARGSNFRAAPAPLRHSNTGYTKAHVQILTTLSRWGIGTLGELAALPRAELRARFGDLGTRMHEVALGQDRQPMVPGEAPRRFVERLALEWPIAGLEPLSFVLARLCETLSKQLEQADRGAVSITTRLALVSKAGFERTLHLPAAMREPRVLRTLILLDLESHPIQPGNGDTAIESFGIDAVELEVEVSPGRIVQGALFVRTLPTPESLSTLIARLGALMGETRIGAPETLDTSDEREIKQHQFKIQETSQKVRKASQEVQGTDGGNAVPSVRALRRLRRPAAIRMASLEIVAKAGPWRSSGRWWRRDGAAWDRDAWDMELKDGRLVRVSRNRLSNNWELEGTYD